MEEKENIVYINAKVNELLATTEVTQYFTNILKESIELTVLFPIKEEITLSKFVISIDDKVVISKVMPKEKAKEKYSDSIASGNTGFISNYSEDQSSYSVNIGNIKPNQKIKPNSIFIQMIGTQDMSYEYNIMEKYPTFHYKDIKENELRNKTLKANIQIETESKITRLIAPFMDEEAKKNSTYEVKYNDDYKKAIITYTKNPDDIKNINNNVKNDNYYAGKINVPSFYQSFCILFRTVDMNNPILYSQYNPELKETAYSINYIYKSKNLKEIPIPSKPDEDNTISYAAKYEDNIINDTPGLFVFLIDQSGSMRGKSIELVKESLLFFIQSLPANSYFQLIGFGSDFKKYNEEPVIYNKENVEKITTIINNLKADLGGTNISSPLSAIYSDKNYSKINLSKNIFLLTDGQVFDREECINLITANASKFRVHSLGIGNDFDKILIERCGKLGKGTSSFIKEVEKINSVVINTLNKCLRPYITDIKFEFQNYTNEIASKVISCEPKNNFTYQNEIMNYSFILPNNQELKDLKVKISGKDPLNKIESDINLNNIIKLENGDAMSKMIVGNALKNNDELIKDEKKEIDFAKKYQILSKNTALFAEILGEEKQQSKLIQVNLNEYRVREPHGFKIDHGFRPKIGCSRPMMTMKAKKCKMSMPNPYYIANKYMQKSVNICNFFSPIIQSNNNNNINNNVIKDDVTRLIMKQDIIEGFWEENEETKTLIDAVSVDRFNKIKNSVNAQYKGKDEMKIIYTILVVYYLKMKYKERLNEFRLIINKADKYLEKNGIKYDNIVSGI